MNGVIPRISCCGHDPMRGELHWAEIVHDDGGVKRRPVLEISAVDLRTPLVVPATTVVRDLPSEVALEAFGLRGVLNTLSAGPIRRENLTETIGLVDDDLLDQVCRALAWTTGCR
jgi:mRNA-degrading endonuclease toxin of MazEF toxin-antitoxin module